MTLEELETLLKRAEDVLGKRVQMVKHYTGKWAMYVDGGKLEHDLQGASIDQCIDRLKQWATPPKPDMLPVLVPIATAEFVAAFESTSNSANGIHSRVLSSLCREALAPYQQPE